MTHNLKVRAFDAKLYGASHEKIFRSSSCDVWGLGPKN